MGIANRHCITHHTNASQTALSPHAASACPAAAAPLPPSSHTTPQPAGRAELAASVTTSHYPILIAGATVLLMQAAGIEGGLCREE